MLQPLTSFRFVAAMLVYLWHCGLLMNYQSGYIGVAFFFVLSGFILAYNYQSKLTLNKISLLKFFIARFAKIYPVYLLTFFLSLPKEIHPLIKHHIFDHKVVFTGLINLLLLQSYIPSNSINFAFNGVSWSLSDEMFFYLLFPVILWLISKFFKVHLLLVSMVIVWLVSIILFGFYQAPLNDWLTYIFPPARIIDFFIGICLGLFFVAIQRNNIETNNKNPSLKYSSLELISIVTLIIAIIYSPNVTQSLRFSLYYLPFLSFLIFVYAFQRGHISMLFSNKILMFLGEISFSFYMIHGLMLSYLGMMHVPYSRIIALLLSLIGSAIIYLFYEEPLRKRIRSGLNYVIDNKYKKKLRQHN